MRRKSPASIQVSAVNGIDADLGWLRGIIVPAGVDVEIVDLGRRIDIAVTHDDEVVTIIGDLETGERAVRSTGPADSALMRFTLHMVQQRQIAQGSDQLRAGRLSTAVQDIATLDGAVVLKPGARLLDNEPHLESRSDATTGRDELN